MRSTRLVSAFVAIFFFAATLASAAQYNDLVKDADQPRGGFTPASASTFLAASPKSGQGCDINQALAAHLGKNQFYAGITAQNIPAEIGLGQASTIGAAFPNNPGGVSASATGLDRDCVLQYTDATKHYPVSSPIIILRDGTVLDATCLQPLALRVQVQQPTPPPATAGAPGAPGPAGPQGPQGMPGTSFPGSPASATAIAGTGGQGQPIIIMMPMPQQAPAPQVAQMPPYPMMMPMPQQAPAPIIMPPADNSTRIGPTFAPNFTWSPTKVDSNDRTKVDSHNRSDVDARDLSRRTSDTNMQDLSRIDARDLSSWASRLDVNQLSMLQQFAPHLFGNTNNNYPPAYPPCPTGTVCPPTQNCQYGMDSQGRCLPPPMNCQYGVDPATGLCRPRHGGNDPGGTCPYGTGTNGYCRCEDGRDADANGFCLPRHGTTGTGSLVQNSSGGVRCTDGYIWDGNRCVSPTGQAASGSSWRPLIR